MQFYFTVHGPSTHLFGKDGLKVCYEMEEDAQQWREAFKEAISHLSTDMVGRNISTDLAQRSPLTSTFQDSPLGRERANSASNMTPIMSPTSSPGSEAFMDHSNMAKVPLSSQQLSMPLKECTQSSVGCLQAAGNDLMLLLHHEAFHDLFSNYKYNPSCSLTKHSLAAICDRALQCTCAITR